MKKVINQIYAKIMLVVFLIAGSMSLQCQTTKEGTMPQYLFPDFSKSKILMKNGQIQDPVMNYNMVTEKMVFIRDNIYYDLLLPEMVDTIYLQESKFVPVGKSFFEVLLSGPAALFIQHTGSILPAGKQVGYGGTSQVASTTSLTSINLASGYYNLPLPGDFIVKVTPVYWIRKDNEMFSFLNERQFINLYPDKAARIKAFIKENRIKVDKRDQLIKLVNYCSNLK